MKKLILGICLVGLLSFATSSYAVNFCDGIHAPKGFYQIAYPLWYTADKITDSSGNTAVANLNLNRYALLIRPIYHTNNFVFQAIIPIGGIDAKAFNDSDGGIGDIVLGAGYFLPVKWMHILTAVNVKMATGHFDRSAAINFGSGQWDIQPEIFLNKFVDRFSFGVALRYFHRIENFDIDLKPGDEFYTEGLVTYEIFKNFRIGPSTVFVKGLDNKQSGTTVANSALMKLAVGGEAIYQITPSFQVMLNAMGDIITENTTEGVLVMSRMVYAF